MAVLDQIGNALGGSVGTFAEKLIGIFKVSATAKAEHQAEMDMAILAQQKELLDIVSDATKGQLEINKVEAASTNWFVAGWRPAVGWVCTLGFFMTFIFRPLLMWGCAIFGKQDVAATFPQLDTTQMMELLMGMLGMGGFRMWEKFNGVARDTSAQPKGK